MGNTLNLPVSLPNNDNEKLKKLKIIVSNLTCEIEALQNQVELQKKMIEIDEKCINELNEENKNLKKSQCDECLICKNMKLQK